jgi:methyl-accepting chemotaxis protein
MKNFIQQAMTGLAALVGGTLFTVPALAGAVEGGQSDHSPLGFSTLLVGIAIASGVGLYVGHWMAGRRIKAGLQSLASLMQNQRDGALQEKFELRGDLANYRGEIRNIVECANQILDCVVDKMEWYRSIVDAVPFPIHVMDRDMNWTFLNKAFEKLMVERGYVRDRSDARGRPCSTANANICKTKNCGVMQLKAGVKESYFDWGNLKCKQDTAPVLNRKGETVGYVETVSDLTSIMASSEQLRDAVHETQGVVKAAISGDLSRRLATQGRNGDLRALTEGVNSLLDNVSSLVEQIKVAAGEVHRGADEMSAGNVNLSQRTEEQSASLEETAASMAEITKIVTQSADSAAQASQLSMAARDQAEKGGEVVNSAVSAMTEINHSSKRIGDIIGVIDEIAFQTNLLALNAAVEAARAGEQGRGFAVVASEVRGLASRSASAAKEIKDLIQDSVRKVEHGSTLVMESGQTLQQIVLSVKKVSDIVAEIAAAAREQSSGIEQINKAVTQMDEMTQQNAALVEEASAASQAMTEQARLLNQALDRYQIQERAVGPKARKVA